MLITVGGMTRQTQREDLLTEVLRYLRAVEAFREEQHEPRWRAERTELGAPGPAGWPQPDHCVTILP